MTVLTSTVLRSGCYLGEGAALNIINKEIILADEVGALVPGTVIAKRTEVGSQTVAAATAVAGNTGNGTVGSLTGDTGAKAGTYRITIIEPASNGGTFTVEDPDGVQQPSGTIGVAYSAGGINFTLADGATDFVAGDAFTVAVSYAGGTSADKYALFDPAATDGTEDPANCAILFHPADSTDSDVVTVATVRGPCTVNGNWLTYKSGMSAGDKLRAKNALRDKGMAVLPQHAGA